MVAGILPWNAVAVTALKTVTHSLLKENQSAFSIEKIYFEDLRCSLPRATQSACHCIQTAGEQMGVNCAGEAQLHLCTPSLQCFLLRLPANVPISTSRVADFLISFFHTGRQRLFEIENADTSIKAR